MTIMRSIPQFLASLGLGLAIAATPFAVSARSGLGPAQAIAKEAESRGGKQAGDDKGGGKTPEKGDDKGGKRGGKAGDDHPGAHSQNGKKR